MLSKLRINRNLLFLKISYFLIYAARISAFPYVNIISTEIIEYEQLAIIFSLVPACSIVGPVLIGFVADKTGNYKVTLIVILLVGTAAHATILWLSSASWTTLTTVQELNSSTHLSWDGSILQLHRRDAIDLPPLNGSVWLQVHSCDAVNKTEECDQLITSIQRAEIQKSSGQKWIPRSGMEADVYELCHQFNCSVSVRNASWTSPAIRPSGKTYIFPILFIIRIIGFVCVDAVTPLLDATGLYMTKIHGGDFSQQKMWAMCSFVVIPLICGALIDLVEQYLGYKDYSVAFIISGITSVAVAPLIFKLDVQVQRNSESMLKTAVTVVKMVDADVFFLVQMVVGLCWGFHFNFIPVYLETQLNSSKTFLGLAMTANGIGSVATLAMGTAIIHRLGPINTVAAGLLLYCTRFIVYYLLQNEWIVLAVESVDGLSGFLPYVAGSYFCASAAPPGMMASLNGILSAAFYGAGRGLGTSLGSALISKLGIRMTYLAFGIASGLTSVLYLLAYHPWLKKIERQRLTSKKVEGVDNPAADPADPPK